jgi:hypothetical protein
VARGRLVPDHKTIADFRRDMVSAVELFPNASAEEPSTFLPPAEAGHCRGYETVHYSLARRCEESGRAAIPVSRAGESRLPSPAGMPLGVVGRAARPQRRNLWRGGGHRSSGHVVNIATADDRCNRPSGRPGASFPTVLETPSCSRRPPPPSVLLRPESVGSATDKIPFGGRSPPVLLPVSSSRRQDDPGMA